MTLPTLTDAASAAVLTLAALATPPTAASDVVLDWNAALADAMAANTDLQNPGYASRSMAMMNVAIHDSFAIVDGTLPFYRYSGLDTLASAPSERAAAASAAHAVLSAAYADQQAALDAALASTLGTIADGPAKSDGVALGRRVGQSVVDRRADDGFDASTQYTPTALPGRWAPDPVNPGQEAWGPGWGDLEPFAVATSAAFAPAPPALTSQKYADALHEVKALGAVDSTTRTAEQTEVGLFWAYDRVGMGTPMRLYSEVLQTIAEDRGNTEAQNAELFARAGVALADAGIVAWDSKFEHDLWRPVSGIRDADLDGNPMTEAMAGWTPLGAPDGEDLVGFTPPFPTYLSGHATFGGALFSTIELFYGTDDIAFTLASDELGFLLKPEQAGLLDDYGLAGLTDAERSFDSLGEAMIENGRSRVYLGIHWTYDDTVARQAGGRVAEAVFAGAFQSAIVPAPGATAAGLAMLVVLGSRRRKGRD